MIVAIITVMVGAIVGNNIASTMKTKEKLAEKASFEQTVKEEKEKIQELSNINDIEQKTEEQIEEDHYTEEYKKYVELTDEEKEKVEVIPRKTIVDYEELENIKEDQKEDLGEDVNYEELPQKFDLRDSINIEIEDQDTRGLCWDFAALTSLETNLALKKGREYDFSEIHVDYITSAWLSNASCERQRPGSGGNFSSFTEYVGLNKGLVLQNQYEYRDYDYYELRQFYNAPAEDITVTKTVEFPAYDKDYFKEDEQESELKNFQSVIKTHIMNYGSVWAGVEMINDEENLFLADSEEILYTDGPHAISIIGWDDNYSKDNFESPEGEKPKHDGAYIVANSWGKTWGNNGYFYISYEDVYVHKEMYGVISTDMEDLISISSIKNTPIREYIEENYADQIINYNGKKYIANYNLGKYKVDLSNRGLENLEDIEIFDGATVIDLSGNNLTSIDGIENILHNGKNFEYAGSFTQGYALNLSNNNIKDLSCLEGKEFTLLNLSGNVGIRGYGAVKQCNSLILDDCGLTELENLSHVKYLESLSLARNNFSNYENFSNFSVMDLNLAGNNIEDLNRIPNINNSRMLFKLDLSNNNIKDVSALADLKIYAIDLSGNKDIEDYSAIRLLPNVKYVGLRECNIKDASEIKIDRKFPDFLDKYSICDYYFFSNDGIDIVDEYAFDVYGITYDLSYNEGISNLSTLDNAGTIMLKYCNLKNISEFNNLEHLTYLDISGNKEISGIYSGNSIRRAILQDCNLNDGFNFFGMQNLSCIDVRNNLITTEYVHSRYKEASIRVNKEELDFASDVNYVQADETIVKVPIVNNKELYLNTSFINIGQLDTYKDIYVDGKNVSNKIYNIIPVTTSTKIIGETVYGGKIEIQFYIDKDIKEESISVDRAPNKNVYGSVNDEIDVAGMVVVNEYKSGVYTPISEYTLGEISGVDFGRAKVEVFNKNNNMTYFSIFVDGIEPEMLDVYDEDIIVPDDFYGEFPEQKSR